MTNFHVQTWLARTGILLSALLLASCSELFGPDDRPLVRLEPRGAISAGFGGGCFLTTTGAAYCWGYNYDGQLGTGTLDHSEVPAAVAGGHTFSQISINGTPSGSGACALTPEGQAYCWGANQHGQVGDGTWTQRNVPTPVAGNHVFVQVAVGTGEQTCALTPEGAAYCWGNNEWGQLGTGDTISRPFPVPVQGGLVFEEIHPSSMETCGLTPEGAVYCWGTPPFSPEYPNVRSPTRIDAPPLVELTRGGAHTCGLTAEGAAYCWGGNSMGQLGTGEFGYASTPQPVAGGHRFVQISAADQHTCALTPEGVAYCWGSAFASGSSEEPIECGWTGDSQRVPYYCFLSPARVAGGHSFVAMDAGTCAITTSGDGYCWGGRHGGSGPVLISAGFRLPTRPRR